jgi:hypothetical protein
VRHVDPTEGALVPGDGPVERLGIVGGPQLRLEQVVDRQVVDPDLEVAAAIVGGPLVVLPGHEEGLAFGADRRRQQASFRAAVGRDQPEPDVVLASGLVVELESRSACDSRTR